MADQISDAEKLQIAQHFLLSSPPCQFGEILKDVRKLVPTGLLTDALATGIARAYNLKNGKVVTSPSGNKVLLSSSSEVDNTHYVDPVTNQVFSVDHLTLVTAADSTVKSPHASLESKRAALQKTLKEYLDRTYKPEDSAVGVYVQNDHIVVVLTSEKPNLRNYWAGRWTSTWTLKLSPKLSLSGETKVNAHYFEDGNIQLQTSRSSPSVDLASGGTDEELAALVTSAIDVAETKTRAALDEMYNTLNTDTLRAMRRTMAVTRSKMEWNVNAVRMTRQTRQAGAVTQK